jgi:DNA-binding CsgD family transcriptional regulator
MRKLVPKFENESGPDRRLNSRLRDSLGRVEQDESLTTKEVAVIRCLLRGEDSATICRALVISPETLKTHFKHLFQKTGTHSRAQLVAHVVR